MDELVEVLYEARKEVPTACRGQDKLRYIRDEFCSKIDAMGFEREKTLEAVSDYLDERIERLDSSTERIRGVLTSVTTIAVTGPVSSLVLAVLTSRLSNNQTVDDGLLRSAFIILALLAILFLALSFAVTAGSRSVRIIKGTKLVRANLIEMKDELAAVRLLREG